MRTVKIDMNNAEFQRDFFNLEKNELLALMSVLKKISQMEWNQFYSDHGLKWEVVQSKRTSSGERPFSFRFSKKYRALALRQGDFLRLLTLHTDHDSAYK